MSGEGYTFEDHEEYRRSEDEKATREAARVALEHERARAFRAWTQDGGRPEDFDREWPKLRDEMRRRRILVADEAARSAQQGLGISRI